MKWIRIFIGLLCLGLALPAAAQDAAALWTGVSQAAFDPAKSAVVENLTLTRDRIRITLTNGRIQFTRPVDGKVFGAAFEGRGTIQVVPPNAIEQQQLELFTGQKSLSLTFTQATFCFNDSTYDEISHEVKWTPVPGQDLGDLYRKRQKQREDYAAQILPRLFQALLSTNATHDAYFLADLKTNRYGWVQATCDAAQLEAIDIGRWTDKPGPAESFDTWMEFPAGNADPAKVDEQPLAKDNYLVRNYRIDATVTRGAKLSATTTLSLQEREPGERVLLFNLDANLRVGSVKDAAGQQLAFFQPGAYGNGFQSFGDYVAVVLPRPTAAGGAAQLTFVYAGKHVIRKVGSGDYFCPSYGWYPSPTDNFATRADFQMTFHSPKRFILTATGEETSRKKEAKELVTQWKSSIPLTVAGFAFGDFKQFDTRVGPTTVQVLADRNPNNLLAGLQTQLNGDLPRSQPSQYVAMGSLNPSNTIKTMGQEIGNSLRVFDDFFGPYPYHKLTVTNIPYSYGQGWPTLIYLSALSFLDSTQRHALGLPDDYRLSDFFRAHETSHQWWGQLVGWKTYHDQWLSEGFAQFSGNLYVEFREGGKQYLQRLKDDKAELLEKNRYGHVYDSLGPLWMGERLSSSLAPRGYDVVVYDKGGWVLQMLRMMLYNMGAKDPDARFKAMMHDYCRTYANKAASTEDFKAIVEKYMTPAMNLDGNHRMDWFFRQYVYGTGIADYTFTYRISPTPNGQWKVAGTVVRKGVPGDWKDILPVYVHLGKGVGRFGWIVARKPTTHFSFLLPQKPDKVSLNDYEDILARFHQ